MKFTVWTLAAAVLAGLFYAPAPASGQSNEVKAIQIVQRDVYNVERKIDELKAAQEGKTGQLEALLKQLTEANAKLTADLAALQETVKRNQNEQQQRVFEPMAVVKQGMEEVSGSVAGIQASLTAMRSKQDKMETMLTDLNAAVRLLATQVTQPAPAAPSQAATPSGPTPGEAASLLFSSAQRDKLSGKLEFALAGFGDVATKFPDSPEAPMAVFEIGTIYAKVGQAEDAVKAFDRVLEQFGDNPMRKDAQFFKAEQLAAMDKRAEAAREYDAFAKKYPSDDNAKTAIARAAELRRPPAAAPKSKAKSNTRKK